MPNGIACEATISLGALRDAVERAQARVVSERLSTFTRPAPRTTEQYGLSSGGQRCVVAENYRFIFAMRFTFSRSKC